MTEYTVESYINTVTEDVVKVCRIHGYGLVMQLASQSWGAIQPGLNHVTGPAAGMTVPCVCDSPFHCEWCCGTGWLTKHVKELIKDTE